LSSTDSVRVTTVVPVDPPAAFEVFTGQVDAWWKRGPRYRPGLLRLGVMRFEPPGVGGRLLDRRGGPSSPPVTWMRRNRREPWSAIGRTSR
jgi:hypothetical protein